jgi:hypothetical protein
MKGKILALAVLFVAVAAQAQAQNPPPPANFTFAGTPILPNGTMNPCSNILTWNGSDPANPPYPYEMGAVCLHQGDSSGGYGSYLDVPFQLGFLNNGYLAGCNPLAWGAKVFTIGDGTHNGDAFVVPGTTTCPYYTGEYGTYENSNNLLVGWSVVASYTVVKRTSCNRGRCVTYFTNVLTGGSGTVQETLLTP